MLRNRVVDVWEKGCHVLSFGREKTYLEKKLPERDNEEIGLNQKTATLTSTGVNLIVLKKGERQQVRHCYLNVKIYIPKIF